MRRLAAFTGPHYKYIVEIQMGPFRSFRLQLRRELRRWLGTEGEPESL